MWWKNSHFLYFCSVDHLKHLICLSLRRLLDQSEAHRRKKKEEKEQELQMEAEEEKEVANQRKTLPWKPPLLLYTVSVGDQTSTVL